LIFKKPLILIEGTGGIVDKIIKGHLMQNIKSSYYVVDSAKKAVEKVLEFLN
jgi:hypothetical protein